MRYLDVDEEEIQKEGFNSVYAPCDTRVNAGVLFDEMMMLTWMVLKSTQQQAKIER